MDTDWALTGQTRTPSINIWEEEHVDECVTDRPQMKLSAGDVLGVRARLQILLLLFTFGHKDDYSVLVCQTEGKRLIRLCGLVRDGCLLLVKHYFIYNMKYYYS